MPWCAAQWWKHCQHQTHDKTLKPLVEKGDASYYVEAAAVKALGGVAANLEEKPGRDKLLKLLKSVLEERAGWNEVVRSGAIAGLLKTSKRH